MTITFIGHGYVGLVTATVFADFGNTVYVIGHTPKKINNLKKGIIPIFEPGLGEMVKKALDQKREREAAGLLASLRPLAYRTQESAIVVDRMIVNAAFLVARSREEEFDRAVRRLDEDLGQRIIFKYVGPVPPYNFVNIVVNWLDL